MRQGKVPLLGTGLRARAVRSADGVRPLYVLFLGRSALRQSDVRHKLPFRTCARRNKVLEQRFPQQHPTGRHLSVFHHLRDQLYAYARQFSSLYSAGDRRGRHFRRHHRARSAGFARRAGALRRHPYARRGRASVRRSRRGGGQRGLRFGQGQKGKLYKGGAPLSSGACGAHPPLLAVFRRICPLFP